MESKSMNEEEEFEFRLRLEKESKAKDSSVLEKVAGHPAYRAVSAIGEPMMGIAELGARKLIDPITGVAGFGHPVGDYLSSAIDTRDEMIERGRADRGEEGFDLPRLAGSVVAPVGLASKYKVGKALLDKVLAGASLSAATGMTMPVGGDAESYDEKKLLQGAISGGFGGAIPVAGSMVKGTGNIIDEVTKPLDFRNKEGIYRTVADALMDVNEKVGGKVIPKSERGGVYSDVKDFAQKQSGDKKAKIIKAMQNADEGQTVGQAIAKANNLSDDVFGGQFVRLERDLSKTAQSGDDINRIYKNQIGGEKSVLDRLSGTNDALESAINKANKQANKGYGAVTGDRIKSESDRQLIVNAINKAQGKAAKSEASKGEALRDWGRFKTLEAQQKNLAGNRIMPKGEARVPPRYAPHAPTVKEAGKAAGDASTIAKQRLIEETTHRDIMDSFIKNQLGTDSRSFGDFFSRPSVIAGMREAKRSAAESGSYFPSKPGDEFTVGNLQRIKRAIAEKITSEKRAGSIGKSTEKEMNDTLKSFVSLLRKKSPGFAKTEDEFIANMKPVNEMNIGRELRSSYSNNTDGLTGGKFITAVQNPKKTVKKATGFRGAKALPEGFDETEEIVKAIQNRAKAKELARNTESIMPQLVGGVEISLPNMLSRPVLLTNAVLKSITRDKSPKYKEILSTVYTDPKKFEKLLTEPAKSKNRLFAEDIMKKLTVISAGSESAKQAGE